MLIRLLPLRLTIFEAVAASAVTGLLCSSWVMLLSVVLLGFRSGLPIAAGVVGIALLVGYRYRSLKIEPMLWSKSWILVTVASAVLFVNLHWTHDLLIRNGALLSAGDTWGDIALHLTLASNFASEGQFSWQFPLFHGAMLTYPFLLDFTSAILHRLGWAWHGSFFVPALVLDLCIVQLIYGIAVRIAKRPLAGLIAVVLFLCGGSAAGWLFAWHTWQVNGFQFTFFSALPVDYSHLVLENLQFTNIVTSELLPQRAFGLGLATVLTCLLFFQSSTNKLAGRTVLFTSLLIGLLPFAHIQSWEVGVVLLGGILVLQRNWRLLVYTLPGLVVASAQLIWQIRHIAVGGFVHGYIGWMRLPQESLLNFWWLNFGLLLPLMLVVGWRLVRSRDHFAQALALLGVGLFVLCNLAILQPNPYDNIKLLLYWYLILCILLADWFSCSRWMLPVMVALCSTGMLSIAYDQQREYVEVSASQVAWAAQVQRVVPEGGLILTSQQHNNPVSMLSGRPIVFGYPGWLWTYGINSSQTASDVAKIYTAAPEAVPLLRSYGIQYVEIGPLEREQYAVNEAFFQRFPAAATSTEGSLYAVGM